MDILITLHVMTCVLHLPTHLVPWLAYQSLHPAYHLEEKISQILDMKQTSANYVCVSVYSLDTPLRGFDA